MNNPTKDLIKLIQKLSYRYSVWHVFSDFCEMTALAISNTVDLVHWEEREKQYLEIVSRYDQKEAELLPQLFATLVEVLEKEAITNGPRDVLGKVFHELELHNKWAGQFFTPDHVCEAMADLTLGDDRIKQLIEEKGFITVSEPTAGSGAMILGFCRSMKKLGLDYTSQMVATAVDVDLKCVHMTYAQLALYGIPAVVIHGNTLSMQEWSRWYTPTYILDGWLWRQKCGMTDKREPEDESLKTIQEPLYAAIRDVEALIAAGTDKKEMDGVPEYEQITMLMKVEVLTKDGWQPAEQLELLHQVPTIDDIIRALSSIRTAVVEDEYKLHETVAKHLAAAGITFEREYRLGPRNRIDFYIPGGTGIEVKKGKPARAQVIAQLERYTRFDKIKAVIFVIERSMDIPEELNGKTCICFPLNKLWGVALP